MNIIIVDNNGFWRERVKLIVEEILIKFNTNASIIIFKDFCDEFYNTLESNLSNLVLILDIVTDKNNGVYIAKSILDKNPKLNIIFLTAYAGKYIYDIYGNEDLKVKGFISKSDDVPKKIKYFLKGIIEQMNNEERLKYREGNLFIDILFKEILYITKEKDSRKTVIITSKGSIYTYKSLSYFEYKYNNQFIRTHRECIVNYNRVLYYNFKNKTIHFDNNTTIDYLSNNYKINIKDKCDNRIVEHKIKVI
ncbi:MAG: LytTR family transcriptional regulator DNA-binding domain-containing protein [Bacilli bacterium]